MTFSHNVAAELSFLASQIPPEAAKYTAKIFSGLAEELEKKSREFYFEKDARVAQIQHRRHIDVLVAMAISEGKTLKQAIYMLSAYDVSPDQARFLYHNLKPRLSRQKRIEHIKTIGRLRKRGLTNAEIAIKLGLSTRTIQRLLKKA